jgi:hypothetical protein
MSFSSMRAAVGWTLAQHGAFFVSAWLVSWWAGAGRFGEWSQALALATVLAALITLRMEYAGQLDARAPRAASLFEAARWLALRLGLGVAVLGAGVALAAAVPWWAGAGALAVAPLALVQVRAAGHAREGRVALAAAVRALPALCMVPLQAIAYVLQAPEVIVWSLPAAAWASLCVMRAPPHGTRRLQRLLCTRWSFVRAEWLGLALNTAANHGQVLAVGLTAGDAAAGVIALGMRVAMLPTSLVGLAWADGLRAQVVASGSRAQAREVVTAALRRMAGVSISMHLVGALAAWLLLPWLFPTLGHELALVVLLLLPLGTVRMVASPVAFLPAWRGWLGLSLLGQCLLFAAALGAALVGLRWGAAGVATAYAAAATCIYVGYLVCALRAVRTDT